MATRGKQRTAFILQPRIVSADGVATDVWDGFWGDLYDRVEKMSPDARTFPLGGRTYRGKASTEPSNGQRYLYLGKVRSAADMPDVSDLPGSDTTAPLQVPGDVLEYLYAYGIGGAGEKCVVLRTSGGASFSAFQKWVGHVLGYEETDEVFELIPVVRTDALERLAQAQGATKLELKIEKGATDGLGAQSELERALRTVADELGHEVSLELGISFGNVHPGEGHSEQLARELRQIVGTTGVKKLKATLVRHAGDGSLARDKVDFINERITYSVEVGDNENQRPTPAVVLQAMGEAVRQYRSQ